MSVRINRITLREILLVFAVLIWITAIIAIYFVVHRPWFTGRLIVQIGVFRDVALSLLTAFLAGGLGNWLLRDRLQISPLEDRAIGYALGLGLLSITGLVLGLLGLLNSWVFTLLLIIGLVVLRKEVIAWLKLDLGSERLSILERAAAVFCLLLVSINLLRSLAPPVKWDSLVYHLEIPRQFVLSGQITALIENVYASFPQAAEVLFAWVMTLGDGPAATTLGWITGVVALFGVEGLARRIVGGYNRWLAPAILLAGLSVSQALNWGYVELWVMLFGLCMLIALDAYGRSGKQIWIALSALMIGFAIGVKYTAVVLLPIAVLILFWDAFRGHQVDTNRGLQKTMPLWLKNVILTGAIVAIAVSPWLIKNWILFGNPMYPFIGSTHQIDPWQQTFYGSPPADRSFLNDLLLPMEATLYGIESAHVIGKPDYSASLGPLMLALIPGLLLGWRRFSSETRRSLSRFLIAGLTAWMLWSAAAHLANELTRSRHYFGIFPALAVLATAGFASISTVEFPGIRVRRVVGALIILALFLASYAEVNYFIASSPLPVIWGSQSESSYIAQELGSYGAAMIAVNQLPANSKVLFLWEPRTYYCDVHCLSDGKLDNWWAFRHSDVHAEDIAQSMRLHGVTHILVNDHGLQVLVDNEQIERSDLDELTRFRSSELILLDRIENAYSIYSLVQ